MASGSFRSFAVVATFAARCQRFEALGEGQPKQPSSTPKGVMAFTSFTYYFFLGAVATLHYFLPIRLRPLCLLLASYAFYVSFRPAYILFLLSTTSVSYCAAIAMGRSVNEQTRNWALGLALAFELLVLGLTKYWNPVASATGLFPSLNLLIPLGISFYTFQTIGYLVDVHRRLIEPEPRLVHHALFLGFFPHLLAGPIEPAEHFLPQVREPRQLTEKRTAFGTQLLIRGLFKKFVIAESLAPLVSLVFDDPARHGGGAAAFALVLARWRIYADFSGYTDIALGSALVLGYELSPNFHRPFFSSSISEYWRRWHISLGNWIRSYIFYPLVVSPFSRFGVPGIVMVTFIVLGVWHGGTFNFLLYGLWQGVFVALDLQTKNARGRFYGKLGLLRFPRFLECACVFCTFFLIVVPPTLFFQAETFATTRAMLAALFCQPWAWRDLGFFSYSGVLSRNLLIAGVAILGIEIFDWQREKNNIVELAWCRSRLLFWGGIVLCGFLTLEFGQFPHDSSFVYMKF